jgi:hypothetical protein
MSAPAGTLTPRREWRTFDPDFGAAGARLVALAPGGTSGTAQLSDAVYLLSALCDANVNN